MGSDVESYIQKLGSPQREIVERLRGIILETLPDSEERLWMGVPWYDKFYIVALRDHVNLGFSVKGLSQREMSLFEGKGKLMRHIKFHSMKDIDEARVAKLLRLAAKKGDSCEP